VQRTIYACWIDASARTLHCRDVGNEGPDAWEDRGIGIERVRLQPIRLRSGIHKYLMSPSFLYKKSARPESYHPIKILVL
jgi:hypothetical protein